MSWVAVAVVGGSVIGAVATTAASGKAASAQTNAANQATQLQQQQNDEAKRQYDLSRADLAPYRNVGYSALSTLAGSTGLTPPAGVTPAATAWGAPAAAPAAPAAAPSGPTPGMIAAQNAPPRSGGGNTPIQDISQALKLGRTITDAQWAQAGYGPRGWGPGDPVPGTQSTASASAPADLPTIPLDQANPTIAPPGTNAAPAPAGPTNDFNRPFTLADFQQDPGYEFRRTEGQRGVEASASARGGLLSGGTLKALDRYNQDYASGEYGKAFDRYQTDLTGRFNRLSSLAGTGQTATNQTVNAGTDLTNQLQAGANNISNNIAAAGNARSSGYVAAGNAVGNAAGNIGQYYALKSFLTPTPAAPVM